jgi:hypothetical protein
MYSRKVYTQLLEEMAKDKGGLYFLNGSQITDKQVGYFFVDSVLCIADSYMKHYSHADTKMGFTMTRRPGNLSPFPLTAVASGKEAMFCNVAPFVSYVFDEHILPYRSELSAVFQLSGSILNKDFDLLTDFPELTDNAGMGTSRALMSTGYIEQDAAHGRSIN